MVSFWVSLKRSRSGSRPFSPSRARSTRYRLPASAPVIFRLFCRISSSSVSMSRSAVSCLPISLSSLSSSCLRVERVVELPDDAAVVHALDGALELEPQARGSDRAHEHVVDEGELLQQLVAVAGSGHGDQHRSRRAAVAQPGLHRLALRRQVLGVRQHERGAAAVDRGLECRQRAHFVCKSGGRRMSGQHGTAVAPDDQVVRHGRGLEEDVKTSTALPVSRPHSAARPTSPRGWSRTRSGPAASSAAGWKPQRDSRHPHACGAPGLDVRRRVADHPRVRRWRSRARPAGPGGRPGRACARRHRRPRGCARNEPRHRGPPGSSGSCRPACW